MKVYIFGCGFVGEAAADLFYRGGTEVVAFVRSPESASRLAAIKPYPVKSCDMTDLDPFKGVVAPLATPDVVVHCASSKGGDVEAYRSIYLGGVRNLLAAFPDARLVYTGSTSVYSQTDESWVDESSATEPMRDQGQVLLDAEQAVVEAGGSVVRLAGIYGPARSMVIRKFVEGSAVLEEGGSRWINQIHRDDAAAAVVFLATRNDLHGVFNCADDSPARQRDIYAWLAHELGRPLPANGPRPPTRARAWTSKRVSNAKLREAGWEPVFSTFREGYRNVLASI